VTEFGWDGQPMSGGRNRAPEAATPAPLIRHLTTSRPLVHLCILAKHLPRGHPLCAISTVKIFMLVTTLGRDLVSLAENLDVSYSKQECTPD
jgi:hypothetical protein